MPATLPLLLHRRRRHFNLGPTPITPLEVTSVNLLRYWDFSQMATPGAVASVTDQSAAADPAVQATAGSQPDIIAAGRNGHNIGRFYAGPSNDLASWLSFTAVANVRFVLFVGTHRLGWCDGADYHVGVMGHSSGSPFKGAGGVNFLDPTVAAANVLGGTAYYDGFAVNPSWFPRPSGWACCGFATSANITLSRINDDAGIAGRNGEYDLGWVALFDGVPTNTEIQGLVGGADNRWTLDRLPWVPVDHNSMGLVPENLGRWRAAAAAAEQGRLINRRYQWFSFALVGQGWGDMQNGTIGHPEEAAAVQIDPLNNPNVPTRLVAGEDSNTINGSGGTAADTLAQSHTYYDARLAAGWTAAQLGRLTCVNRFDGSTAPDPATCNAKIATLNTSVRGEEGGTRWKYVGDMGADALMIGSTAMSGPISEDQIHPSDYGAEAVVGATYLALAAALVTGAPFVYLRQPNQKELFYLGDVVPIRWSAVGVVGAGAGTVKIELSRDGGSTWETLSASHANDGVFDWTSTGAATSQARVRVSDTANPAAAGASQGNFFLSAVPTLPNAGWLPTSQAELISWWHAQASYRDASRTVRAYRDQQRCFGGLKDLGTHGFDMAPPDAARTSRAPLLTGDALPSHRPCLTFDGRLHYLTKGVDANMSPTTITVGLLVRFPTIPWGRFTPHSIVLNREGQWRVGQNDLGGGANSNLSVVYGTSVHGWAQVARPSTALTAATWTAVVIRYDGANWQWWKDGVADGTVAETGTLLGGAGGNLVLGSTDGGAALTNFDLHTLAIFSALSDANVTKLSDYLVALKTN